jgi:putative flippase GtrA
MDPKTFLRDMLARKSGGTLGQLVRYTFVGGLAFLVDFGLLYVLTDGAGLYYLLSATLSFLAGLVVNYVLSVSWVFSRRTLESRWAEFLIFAIIGVVGVGLNALFMWLFTEVVGLHYLVSKMGSAVLVFLWNFFARKLSLFR